MRGLFWWLALGVSTAAWGQRPYDDAPPTHPGGQITVEAGERTAGGRRLHDHTELRFEAGALVRLEGPLYGSNATNITVSGPGRLQTEGTEGAVRLENCRNVALSGLHLQASRGPLIVLKNCENVRLESLTIDAAGAEHAAITLIGCEGVTLHDVRIEGHGTALRVDGGRDVDVRGGTWAAAVGAYVTAGRAVHFADLTLRTTTAGLWVRPHAGTTVAHLTADRITFEDLPADFGAATSGFPVCVDAARARPGEAPGTVRDVAFRDCYTASAHGWLLQGSPDCPLAGVSLSRLRFQGEFIAPHLARRRPTVEAGGPLTPQDTTYAMCPAWVTVAHAVDLSVDGLRTLHAPPPAPDQERHALAAHHTEGLNLRDVYRRSAADALAVVRLHDCRRALLTNCLPTEQTLRFLHLSGTRTGGVSLIGNVLTDVAEPIYQAPEVYRNAVEGTLR
ncbi:MAG: hypothetical protein WBA12_01650 [Catalinimonas sp.]